MKRINEIVFIAFWEGNVVLWEKLLFLEVIYKCNVLYCSQTRNEFRIKDYAGYLPLTIRPKTISKQYVMIKCIEKTGNFLKREQRYPKMSCLYPVIYKRRFQLKPYRSET